jgi:hypothetical protein
VRLHEERANVHDAGVFRRSSRDITGAWSTRHTGMSRIRRIAVKYRSLVTSATVAALTLFAITPARSDGLVIRSGTCSAEAFKNGSGVTSIPPGSDNIFDLSVNCTEATNKKQQFAAYTAGIVGGPPYCVSTIADLERVSAQVKKDPIVPGNPLHCLVNGNAQKIAGKLTRSP